MSERRLEWLCRRGMRELDVLLDRYRRATWPTADRVEQEAFAALLEEEDPDIWDWLMERRAPPPRFADVIERIRRHP